MIYLENRKHSPPSVGSRLEFKFLPARVLFEESWCCSFKQMPSSTIGILLHGSTPDPNPWLAPHPFLFLTGILTHFIIHSPILPSLCLSELMHVLSSWPRLPLHLGQQAFMPLSDFRLKRVYIGNPVCKPGENAGNRGLECSDLSAWGCPLTHRTIPRHLQK